MFKSMLMFGASMAALAATDADALTFVFTGQKASYTVETTGLYSIAAFGAAGGNMSSAGLPHVSSGGVGASASGRVTLTAGTVLGILVGGAGASGYEGTNGGGGGGGGTFVFLPGSEVLAVAGGGGGGGQYRSTIARRSVDQGDGGGAGASGYFGSAGGGAGSYYFSNGGAGQTAGQPVYTSGLGGMTPQNGGAGGAGGFKSGAGGFGGGGGGGYRSGGGGGGYGGGSGTYYDNGQGGSSFLRSGPGVLDAVLNQVYGLNTAGADGRFEIDLVPSVVVPPVVLPPVVPAAVPEPRTWLSMILGSGFVGLLLRRRRKAFVPA